MTDDTEQFNVRISARIARLLRAYAALRGMTLGALIEEMCRELGIEARIREDQ